MNLTIQNAANITWTGGGLRLDSPTRVDSVSSAAFIAALQASNEITIEAWIQPSSASQSGPARIATLSSNGTNRNFTLGQDGSSYVTRLRTSSTGNNGTPNIGMGSSANTPALQHVVFTRSSDGSYACYLDGVLTASGSRGGDFSNWSNSYGFALGNELNATNGSRDWLGEYRYLAIYDRALDPQEVQCNFTAGSSH